MVNPRTHQVERGKGVTTLRCSVFDYTPVSMLTQTRTNDDVSVFLTKDGNDQLDIFMNSWTIL